MLSKLLDSYYRLLQILLTLLMAGLLVPVGLQILSRYTGLIPRYIWTEEIARFCFIWIVMIGAMIAVRDGTHFDVDILPKLGQRANAILRLFTHLAMLAVALIFVTYGYQFAKFGSIQTSEIAGLPMLAIYIAWPLAGVTWLAFLGEKFIEDIHILRGEIPPPDHDVPRAE
jgi:TRAP-type C4-dicarboxylate transport system permease small subunit